MASLVIVGAQWGDEGKGKLVDVLTERADSVVRFHGGNNAGHTLVVDGRKVKLSLIPSGVLRPQCRCLIGAGVVMNLDVFFSELETLAQLGIDITPSRMQVDRDAAVILPYHILIDRERERIRASGKIGTTGRGIGPCYEDRAARCGFRVGDLLDMPALRTRFEETVSDKNRYLKLVLECNELVDVKKAWSELETLAARLAPYVGNVGLEADREIRGGKNVVFEGAQGTLLDVMHGTVPYVTSSSTIASSAASGTGIGPKLLGHVLGVTKAYATRVGSGPMPTELHDEFGERLRQVGQEFGTVTGRPRRCGWLDMVLLRRSIRLNGCDSLAVTKLDVLTGFETVKICTGYKLDGKALDDVPVLLSDFDRLEPQFEEFPGWEVAIDGCRDLAKLPATAQAYLRVLEELAECPVSLVSVGPERTANILLPASAPLRGFIGA